MPDRPGATDGRLLPCPDAPKCVSSEETRKKRRVEPFRLAVAAERAWKPAVEAAATLPRARVVTRTDDYLHVECRSALFRFVDDLELHLRSGEGVIAVRSCSRLGYYDFGVNRRRVEKMRDLLRESGVVR